MLTGEHDVDKKWMKEVQTAKDCPHRLQRDDTGHHFPNTLVVPRFHVDGWTLEAYQALFTPDSSIFKKFVDLVSLSLQSHQLDGFVLDAGYLNFRAPWRAGMIALFKALGAATKAQSKLFILVVPVRFLPKAGCNALSNAFRREMVWGGQKFIFFRIQPHNATLYGTTQYKIQPFSSCPDLSLSLTQNDELF